MKKLEVGVLGATGMVGQQFAQILAHHPWFELTWVGASDRSAGQPYGRATSWRLDGEMPGALASRTVRTCVPEGAPHLMFSAMDAAFATDVERSFATAGCAVVSNSRNHRMEPDVPLLVPEVNAAHLALVSRQRRQRGWSGQIITNPNCSTVVLTMALAPLQKWGIERVVVTTMQAVSGAGYPGVASLDISGNVIPFIGGEEEKMQQETQKILGTFTESAEGGEVRPLAARVSAHCNRVPVVDGHTVTVSVELAEKPSLAEVRRAFEEFSGVPQERALPSAPAAPLLYLEQDDRPQPRRDALRQNGMAVSIGRLRECPVFDLKFVACGHNTIRGAAGAAILNAELMLVEGLLD